MPCCSPGHVTDHPQTCGTPREQYHQWSQTATISVSTICQCVPPQAVGQHQLHEQRPKKRDVKRLIRVKTPRLKARCEVAVALRGREHRLTLSWGRALQLRSSSANSLGPSPSHTLWKSQRLHHTFHNTVCSNTCLSHQQTLSQPNSWFHTEFE